MTHDELNHVIFEQVVDNFKRFKPIDYGTRVSIHINPAVSFYCNDNECECKK